MRIAILADIHGNLPAFEAALAHARRLGVDQFIIAGDLVNGAPDSWQCWQLAQSLQCPILRGNHERYVFDLDEPHAPALWQTERFAPVRWTASQFVLKERQALRALPLSLRLPEAQDVLFVHASLRRDNDSIAAYTPEPELAAMFPESHESLIVRGHEHSCQVRLWDERAVVTAGSTGWALDESQPAAQYLLIERRGHRWQFHHQAVAYDIGLTVERFHATGYLKAAGPMAHLMLREIVTASPQIVPFLRAYEHWSQQAPLSLHEGIERFFKIY
ncbi:MAG: metallophosphoesterase [Caldilineaceae bacterium]